MIYVIESGGLYKIGFTSGQRVEPRMRALQTASALPLKLIDAMPGTMADEHAMHARFAHLRVHGEWFRLSEAELEWIAGAAHMGRALHGYPETPPYRRELDRKRFEALLCS